MIVKIVYTSNITKIISFKDRFIYFTGNTEALLNIEENEESQEGFEQPLDLSTASQPRNTERGNIQGSDSDSNNTNSAFTF